MWSLSELHIALVQVIRFALPPHCNAYVSDLSDKEDRGEDVRTALPAIEKTVRVVLALDS